MQERSKISDKSVNVICTDLPYGITACTWDSVIPLDKLWEQYKRVIADNGIIILFGQESFSSLVRTSNLEGLSFSTFPPKSSVNALLFAEKSV